MIWRAAICLTLAASSLGCREPSAPVEEPSAAPEDRATAASVPARPTLLVSPPPVHETRPPVAQGPAVETVSERIVDALRCDQRPEPTPILVELVNQGLIAPAPDSRVDDVSCFYLREALELTSATDDLVVTAFAICAFDENYSDHAETRDPRYWNLYRRGPGTSPGQRISVYVSREERTWDWMRANDSRIDTSMSSWPESTLGHLPLRPWTEITCNRTY